MTEERSFITNSNFKRICHAYSNEVNNVSLQEIYSLIFSENLNQILNGKEAREKFIQLKIIENEPSILEKLSEHLEKISKKLTQKSKNYVFDSTVPKFHKDENCKYLNKDYVNYLIPEQIKNKGDDAISEFKAYCQENRRKLEEKPDAFWAIANIRFKIVPPVTPTSVSANNSGTKHLSNLSEAEILKSLNDAYKKCIDILEENSKNKTLSYFKYGSPNSKDIETISDEEDKKLVREYRSNKKIIIDNLFTLYIARSQSDNLSLPRVILEKLYMKPCLACNA